MKTKIKNIILIFVAFMFCMTTMNVSAATLDSTSCDGPIYTNYYYLLDIEYYNDDAFINYGNNFSSPYSTLAAYTNNVISINEAKNYGLIGAAEKNIIKIERGQVNLTTGTCSSTSVDCMTLNDFYTNFMSYIKETNGNKTIGNTSHIVQHSWAKGNANHRYQFQEDQDTSILNLSPDVLIKASLNTPTTMQFINDNETEASIFITRSYDDKTNTKPYGASFNELPDGAAAPAFDGKSFLQPALYYVQYCKSPTTANVEMQLIYKENAGTDTVTGMPNDVSFTISTTISDKKPTRTGYTFVEWNTKSDGTGTKYTAGTEVNKNLTLYAIWKKNETPVSTTFKIEYDANGGTNAPDTQNGTVGECLTISETIPKQSKNKFLGWSTNDKAPEPDKDENGNLKYEPGKSTYCGGSGDLKLYAVWQPISGVESHLLVFAIVALSAGIALIVTKRKGLFKQI